ncbi:glycerophosphodiester phosphodiesterase family protein [Mangrovimonas cancribranchiae]|uniref:Glycerophosphodiester phosphodiesterase family protein n=1 Tax=Mangrovimonas cancribranchiae TaxID=3080055 RepID=A0AAU6NYF6_9FLAO
MKSLKILFAITLSTIIMSCEHKNTIGVQGHRGCRGILPENSLPAFKKAIELGVNTLELDLAISKDKKVVVSHEPFISRFYCLDPSGAEIPEEVDKLLNLYTMNYEVIKQFDCGSKIHERYPEQQKMVTYKPLLNEVFVMADSLNEHIKYNIELKARLEYDNVYTPEPKEFVTLVLNEIKEHHVFNRCNLQSFDVRILEEIKQQAPKMDVALLIDDDENIEEKLTKLSFKPEIISPYYELLIKSEVKDYQKQGFKIIPWTVNEVDDMKVMIDFGVNAIITDYPNKLIPLLKD